MSRWKILLGVVLAAAFATGDAAWARGGDGGGWHRGGGGGGWHRGGGHHGGGHARVGIGLYFGAPYAGSWYYPPYYPPALAYPAYPVVAAVPASPPVYVERGNVEAPATAGSGYWYYCQDPSGYYPYVADCPAGWMTVVPQAPPR